MVLKLLRASAARYSALAVLMATFVAGPAAADVNRIVLRVNNEIATLYEFEQRRRSRIREIQQADLPPERRQRLLAEAGEATLREMYEELLVLSRASQLDIRVSDREVRAAVQQTMQQFGIESEEDFRTALASSGMTIGDLEQQMRRNLLIRDVMGQEVQQRIELEEEDLRRYYRDHPEEFSRPRRLQVREVVIPDTAADDDEARAELAAEVRSALLAGAEGSERLTELAEEGSATSLLDLGWIERGDLEAALEREIWDLEAGAVSEPVAARGGLHLVEILAEEEARLLPFGDVQDGIRNKLRQQRYQVELTNFLTELEENSHVVQNPPPEAAGFRVARERAEPDELSGFTLIPEAAPEDAPEAPPEDASETPPEGASEGAIEPEPGTSEPPE